MKLICFAAWIAGKAMANLGLYHREVVTQIIIDKSLINGVDIIVEPLPFPLRSIFPPCIVKVTLKVTLKKL